MGYILLRTSLSGRVFWTQTSKHPRHDQSKVLWKFDICRGMHKSISITLSNIKPPRYARIVAMCMLTHTETADFDYTSYDAHWHTTVTIITWPCTSWLFNNISRANTSRQLAEHWPFRMPPKHLRLFHPMSMLSPANATGRVPPLVSLFVCQAHQLLLKSLQHLLEQWTKLHWRHPLVHLMHQSFYNKAHRSLDPGCQRPSCALHFQIHKQPLLAMWKKVTKESNIYQCCWRKIVMRFFLCSAVIVKLVNYEKRNL